MALYNANLSQKPSSMGKIISLYAFDALVQACTRKLKKDRHALKEIAQAEKDGKGSIKGFLKFGEGILDEVVGSMVDNGGVYWTEGLVSLSFSRFLGSTLSFHSRSDGQGTTQDGAGRSLRHLLTSFHRLERSCLLVCTPDLNALTFQALRLSPPFRYLARVYTHGSFFFVCTLSLSPRKRRGRSSTSGSRPTCSTLSSSSGSSTGSTTSSQRALRHRRLRPTPR